MRTKSNGYEEQNGNISACSSHIALMNHDIISIDCFGFFMNRLRPA